MTTSSKGKRALSSSRPKAQISKEGPTRTRTQTEKGKYNVHSRKQGIPKGVTKGSESEDSSEEYTCRPHKKRSKLAEETDSEDVDTIDGNGSKSGFQVSVRHLLLSL